MQLRRGIEVRRTGTAGAGGGVLAIGLGRVGVHRPHNFIPFSALWQSTFFGFIANAIPASRNLPIVKVRASFGFELIVRFESRVA